MEILLVGESTLVLQGLATLLRDKKSFGVCGTVRLCEAGAAIAECSPDMVVTETGDVPAIRATLRAIHEALGDRPLVVIAPRDAEHFLAALRAGARGFVSRDVVASELLSCIEVVARGEWGIPRGLVGGLVHAYLSLAESASAGAVVLTERDRQILALLAQGLSSNSIARALFLSESTVRSTIRSLAQKLGVRNRMQVVTEAVRQGLVAIG